MDYFRVYIYIYAFMNMYWQQQIRPYITLFLKSHAGDLASLPVCRRTHTQTEEKALSLIYSIIRDQYFQWPLARRVCMPLSRLNGTAQDWEYLTGLAMCQKWVGRILAWTESIRFFYVEAIIHTFHGSNISALCFSINIDISFLYNRFSAMLKVQVHEIPCLWTK